MPPLSNPTIVSTGGRHTCAIDDVGVHCWGVNDYDQVIPLLPLTLTNLTNPTAISAGRDHTCAISDEGVQCWGRNNEGQVSSSEENRRFHKQVPCNGL